MNSPQNEQLEFYAPFAHIPGKYEWCRIHSAGYGSFDTFIIIEDRTDTPVTVYLTSEKGGAFMRDRYPESRVYQAEHLIISTEDAGRTVSGNLKATEGPVSNSTMVFTGLSDTAGRIVPYGADDYAVWGSQWSCSGVDMEISCRVTGTITQEGSTEIIDSNAVVTLGSYGIIRPLPYQTIDQI